LRIFNYIMINFNIIQYNTTVIKIFKTFILKKNSNSI